MKRCFFLGSNKILNSKKDWVKAETHKAIDEMLSFGVTEFYSMVDVGFEVLGAKCVADKKAENKEIVLFLRPPFAQKKRSEEEIEDLKEACAKATMISPFGKPNFQVDPMLQYFLYVQNIDAIIIYKEKHFLRRKKDKEMDILIKCLKEHVKIIYIE